MRRPKLARPGVTLIEIILAAGLTAALTLLIAALMNGAYKDFSFETERNEVVSETSLTLDRMVRNIRLGQNLLNQYTLNNQTYTASNETIIVQIPSINSDGTIQEDKQDVIIYTKNPNQNNLQEIIVPANGSSRTSTTTNFFPLLHEINFIQNVNSIEITLVGAETIEGRISDYSLNQKIKLRNYVE